MRGTLVVAALLLTGCAVPVSSPQPELRVCGTIEQVPVRVADDQCLRSPHARWYSADPFELDSDDYTPIGAELDDDYLDGRYADSYRPKSSKKTSAPKTTKKKPTKTAKPKPSR